MATGKISVIESSDDEESDQVETALKDKEIKTIPTGDPWSLHRLIIIMMC